jgi:hypothetical protein
MTKKYRTTMILITITIITLIPDSYYIIILNKLLIIQRVLIGFR